MNALELAQRFADSVAAKDESTARALCDDDAWAREHGSLAKLFRQLTGRGRSFTLHIGDVRTSEATRAVVACTVHDEIGEPLNELALLCDHVPRRITGFSKSALYCDRYLARVVPPHLSVDDLDPDDAALAAARALAADLTRAAAGDDAARARLAALAEHSSAEVIAHLQLRSASNQRLDIARALRYDALGSIAVEARIAVVDPAGDAPVEYDDELWLYAHERDDGEGLVWSAMTTMFHLDTLLA